MKIGVLTGGGDCMGLNAVIKGVVWKGIDEYGYEFVGWTDKEEMTENKVSHSINFSFEVEGDRMLEANFESKMPEEKDQKDTKDQNKLYIGEKDGFPKVDGDDQLALVTKETTLGEYEPDDLKELPDYLASPETFLRKKAREHLLKMYDAAQEDGITLWVNSAYRSYNTQDRIFERNVERRGSEEKANRSSARAGQSEHQLGTTVDFGGTGEDWNAEFAKTPQGKWLAENAHLFGFAMSYPEDSKEITGYIFEPWHYRYIGVDKAQEWKDSGKVLVEFIKGKKGIN